MPVSRSGKLYFTEEQLQRARACSALDYARAHNYDLVRDGSAYRLREHDSMVFKENGGWFWNSRGVRGRAIELLIHFERYTLPEAVRILTGDGPSDGGAHTPAKQDAPKEKKLFELPERAPQFRQLFAYLCVTRKLDFDLVRELVRQGRLYESIHPHIDKATGEAREIHNAVFLGLDEQGVPRSGFQRGLCTYSIKPYKRELVGSEKEHFAFCVPAISEPSAVAVFEASIDAISHATLEKLAGGAVQGLDRLALGGNMNWGPLLRYLQKHPEIRGIRLCLDNDAGGLAGVEAIQAQLKREGYAQEQGYRIFIEFPPAGRDWNEYLVGLNH